MGNNFLIKKSFISCKCPIYKLIYNYKLIKIFENSIEKIITNNQIYKISSFLYFANPNQPSGMSLSKKNINVILNNAKKFNKFVVIDEAYIDFSSRKASRGGFFNIFCSNSLINYRTNNPHSK